MSKLTYVGGPLDGRLATISATGDIRIPLYGKGYERPATKHLTYKREGRTLVFVK